MLWINIAIEDVLSHIAEDKGIPPAPEIDGAAGEREGAEDRHGRHHTA